MQNTVLRTSDTEELIEILALLEAIAAESKHISNVHVETAQKSPLECLSDPTTQLHTGPAKGSCKTSLCKK
jgi:hypothetical protein